MKNLKKVSRKEMKQVKGGEGNNGDSKCPPGTNDCILPFGGNMCIPDDNQMACPEL
ncbi:MULTISPECIES: hypothetical protein [unclassified Chryseobacterium]|uniref:bacteriocin-like protein n=1 Tax=unclassified Chryseobacterium TaxID=2593645 RepID=UPI0013DDF2CA|nr:MULTISPECIES: hypothetical protein [unclassified Chryseobacterium]